MQGISGGAIRFTGISLVYGVIALAIGGDRQNNIILLTAPASCRTHQQIGSTISL